MRRTRFLRNAAVSCSEMLAEAAERTAARCAGRHVLAIQDTTVLRSSGGGGEYLHAVLALDAQAGTLLGLIAGPFLAREGGRRGSRRAAGGEGKGSIGVRAGGARGAQGCAGSEAGEWG